LFSLFLSLYPQLFLNRQTLRLRLLLTQLLVVILLMLLLMVVVLLAV
jgi:hypothetical protein